MAKKTQSVSSSFWANVFKAPPEKSDLETVLHSMPPFAGLDNKHMKLFLEQIHNRSYQANEYIFHQGDPGIGLYIIRDGEVLITQTTETEENLDLVNFHRGDFFGELALINNDVRTASAIALKESNLAVIFKPDLDEFIEKYPKYGIQILRGMSVILSTRLIKVNTDYQKLYNRYQLETKKK